MKLIDILRKDKEMIKKSHKFSLEELFSNINIGDEKNSKDIILLAELLESSAEKHKKYIYTATTLKRALKKATKDLKLLTKDLNYEIIQDARVNFFGMTRKPCVIKVKNFLEKNQKKDYFNLEDINKIKKEDLFPLGVEININSSKGISLKKIGKNINEELILREIKERYSGHIDQALFSSFISSDKKEILLGEYIANKTEDASISFFTSDDDAKAYVYMIKPGYNGADIEKGEIIKVLKTHEVRDKYVDFDLIKKIEENKIYSKKILVALAKPAIHGRDEELIFPKEMVKEVDLENDKIDFKTINPVINVKEGDIVFYKSKIGKNEDGVNIYGANINSRQGKILDLSTIIDTDIDLDEEEAQATAKISGQLIKNSKGEYSIREIMIINGDVGPKTGNINFQGSVEIKGDILAGYNVKAGGNLNVGSSIEGCHIDVEGIVVVKKGINGNKEAVIKCGDLYSKFVQDSDIRLTGNLYVEEGIIRCNVYVDDSIAITGKRANIISSTVYAYNNIKAKSIGSSNEARVFVKVGMPGNLRLDYEKVQKSFFKLGPLLTKLELDIDTIEKKGPLYIAKNQERYDSLVEQKEEKEISFNKSKKKKRNLEVEIEKKMNKEASIETTEDTFLGVTIVCCNAKLDIKRENHATTYKLNPENPKFIYLMRKNKGKKK